MRTPAGCGDADRFFARVAARTGRFRIAQPGEPSRVFIVEVTEQKGDGASGRLIIEAPGGGEAQREISAQSCQEALDGLAFITALAIDPEASSAPADSAATPPEPPAPPERSRWAAGLVAGGYAMGAVAPEPLFGGRVGIELLAVRTGVFAPSARLVVQRAGHPGFETDWGVAHITYTGAAVEACPLRFGLANPLGLRPCLEGGAGLVDASGSEAPHPESSQRTWGEIGLEARLEWAIRANIALEVAGGYFFPLRRDRFLFGPYLFHEVPAAGAMATLGLNLRVF